MSGKMGGQFIPCHEFCNTLTTGKRRDPLLGFSGKKQTEGKHLGLEQSWSQILKKIREE